MYDSDEVFFPRYDVNLRPLNIDSSRSCISVDQMGSFCKVQAKLDQGRENTILRTKIFRQDPYLIHVPKKLVQGHRTLTMTILWLKHEQEMIYNLNKDFTHDSALTLTLKTLTLNQDRILFQGHLTPFDKRQFTGTSDVIYDKQGGGECPTHFVLLYRCPPYPNLF